METLKQFEFEKDYRKFLVNPIGHFQITLHLLHLCFKTSFYAKPFWVKMSLFCMKMRTCRKTHFHINGFAERLVLSDKDAKGNRQLEIRLLVHKISGYGRLFQIVVCATLHWFLCAVSLMKKDMGLSSISSKFGLR